MAATKVSLKLVVDKKNQRLLFAEADKEFVDFLFGIFSLPVGTVTRLLKEQNMVGCLPSLYKSIENLDDACFQPSQNKSFLLKPTVVIPGPKVPLILPKGESFACRKQVSRCEKIGCSFHLTRRIEYNEQIRCQNCINYVNQREAGYVKGMVPYMVTDDLEVKPMSTNFGITMLREFSVKAVGAIEEKVVDLGMDEGVKLLGASLHSKTVLTDVFLRNEELMVEI